MPRVKGGYVTRRRRKRILKLAKGYFGSKHILYKTAHEQVMKSLQYAYRDRKQVKRDFRKLWITRINAACRYSKLSYSKFMHGLKLANIEVNRKMLAELAITDLKAFSQLVEMAKDAISNPSKYAVETKVEVIETKKAVKKEVVKEVVKEEVKVEVKKEAKKEVKEEVKVEVKEEVKAPVKAAVKEEAKVVAEDLSSLTVAQLKDLAKERGIAIPSGSRKADIIELLS